MPERRLAGSNDPTEVGAVRSITPLQEITAVDAVLFVMYVTLRGLRYHIGSDLHRIPGSEHPLPQASAGKALAAPVTDKVWVLVFQKEHQ